MRTDDVLKADKTIVSADRGSNLRSESVKKTEKRNADLRDG
jgi:hypothetical protein